jgi:hypothetical protein
VVGAGAGAAAGAGVAAGAAAGAGAAAVEPTASIVAITAPTVTVSPSLANCAPITPAAGAVTSTATLSVSRLAIASSSATASPGCFSHLPMLASETLSPSVGTLISVGMSSLSLSFAGGFRNGLTTRAHRRPGRPVRRHGAWPARWRGRHWPGGRHSARALLYTWPL